MVAFSAFWVRGQVRCWTGAQGFTRNGFRRTKTQPQAFTRRPVDDESVRDRQLRSWQHGRSLTQLGQFGHWKDVELGFLHKLLTSKKSPQRSARCLRELTSPGLMVPWDQIRMSELSLLHLAGWDSWLVPVSAVGQHSVALSCAFCPTKHFCNEHDAWNVLLGLYSVKI